MSFKFNFNTSEENQDCFGETTSEDEETKNKEKREVIKHTEEIFVDNVSPKISENIKVIKQMFNKDVEIRLIDPSLAEETVCSQLNSESDVATAVNQQSDLIQGIYEGGLKVWECGIDMVNYLISNQINIQDKNILELGCGAGLPGIYSVLNGAKVVDFQDYNKEVIEEFTIPNVSLNQQHEVKCHCRYIAGDWGSLSSILTQYKYDIILTAETIYNIDNYNKLVSVFDQLLKEDGVIYIAAKSYYFGVGGGTRQFEQYLKDGGKFNSHVVEVISAGVPREILKVRRNTLDKT
ncbi:histidine protein methyltransferase 1 homolog [Patella vulgata]|uniref:histidine protein methyltransferase 1 homolog n=1 Tax=Patella vulgata TaxID=6465 RepID=UPI0021800286|nr:histidine protein methyltransferase 1 homolog [Patella vulgata]